MRNDRNTNNEFSLVPHKFIAPAGEKKKQDKQRDRKTDKQRDRKTKRGGGGWGGNKGREGTQCHHYLITF